VSIAGVAFERPKVRLLPQQSKMLRRFLVEP
jgi:hypothetical protein